MAATIQIGDELQATVTRLVWSCKDKTTETVLNSLTELCKIDSDGAWQGGGANPDYFCAEWMTRNFPGQRRVVIIHFDMHARPQFDEAGNPIVY